MINKMFTSLKNKIRDETGADIPRRFPPRPARPPALHASNSSLGSAVSSDMDGNILASADTSPEISALLRAKEQELREKEREWKEKMTSLQNNMQAAQEVWCGEAAAARREWREEARRSAARAEQLQAATEAAARAQDRLDQALEEIEAERRGWAQERLRLAAEALQHLALAQPTSISDEGAADNANPNELALKRKLEEAQLHLHDIKTSWSGQIAALETQVFLLVGINKQVGRLSRQAGEEGAERRRAERERDLLLQRLHGKETQLEQAQATLQDREAKDRCYNSSFLGPI